jgi:hypothetical protein
MTPQQTTTPYSVHHFRIPARPVALVLVILSVLGGFAARGRTEPVTLGATLLAAYEAGQMMYNVVKVIGDAYTPDANRLILEQLAQIQSELSHIRQAVEAIRAAVERIEDHLVREANAVAINEVYEALDSVRTAVIAIEFMQRYPEDSSHAREAATASYIGLHRFVERLRMYDHYGPLLSDVRFDHRAAYPAYLFALATRLAYLKLAHGSGGLTAPGIASELRLHAAHLDWLRSHLEAAVQCTATEHVFSYWVDPWTQGAYCTVHVACRDGITLEPREPNPDAGETYEILCFAAFDPQWHEEDPERERWHRHGYADMGHLRDMLQSLATYGRGTTPYIGNFGALTAPIVSTLTGQVLDATMTPGNGVRPSLEDWQRKDWQYWVWEVDGTIRSYHTGQCLDVWGWSTTAWAPVQMWDCHSGNNQRWQWRDDGTIRSVHSGQCLTLDRSCSWIRTPWGGYDLVCFDRQTLLIQAPCTGQASQRFTTRNPDYTIAPR